MDKQSFQCLSISGSSSSSSSSCNSKVSLDKIKQEMPSSGSTNVSAVNMTSLSSTSSVEKLKTYRSNELLESDRTRFRSKLSFRSFLRRYKESSKMENVHTIETVTRRLDELDEIYRDESNLSRNEWLLSKWQIYKNLLVLSFSWTLLFTAFQSIANLQSSLNDNSDDGFGTASLSSIYITLILSCLFLPSIMIKNIGLKWTIALSQLSYLLFIAANMYPKWYILMPAAACLGFGAAPLWTAKCTYVSEIAHHYSKLSMETTESVVNRFFGIFFAMLQTTQIWGNIVSSAILRPQLNDSHLFQNVTVNRFCGALDCPGSPESQIKKPSLEKVYLLCAVYLALAALSILIVVMFLSPFKQKRSSRKKIPEQCDLLVQTLKHLRKPYQLLIIPLTLWLGFIQAFIGADFTKSFVACSKGVEYVGLTMICFGITNAISSYFFGQLVYFIGRIPCFLMAAIINYAIIILMIFWIPNPDQSYILFIIPIFWGLADASWQTQSNAIYGVLFKDTHEAAFSNFRLWESLGFAIAYAYSSYLCVSVKLYLLLAYLTTGLIGYGLIEFMERKRESIDITDVNFDSGIFKQVEKDDKKKNDEAKKKKKRKEIEETDDGIVIF